MRHIDPMRRVRAFIRRPSGEGTPVVVLGDFGAEEEVAFADHFPDDVDDFEPAAALARGGEVHGGDLESGAQSAGGG